MGTRCAKEPLFVYYSGVAEAVATHPLSPPLCVLKAVSSEYVFLGSKAIFLVA